MNKRNYSITIPESLRIELCEELLIDGPEESATFLLAGQVSLPGESRLLARRLVKIPRELYREKLSYHLEIAPQAINGIASLCQATKLTAILCHSHPSAATLVYSPSDDFGERRLSEFLFAVNGGFPIGSLLISKKEMIGRVWLPTENGPIELNSMRSIGDVIRFYGKSGGNSAVDKSELLSRQVLLLGEDGQSIVSSANVGIIGCGGTGSCVAEQLARLGVGKIVLVDDDHLERSNISRMYGSYPRHFRRKPRSLFSKPKPRKVEVVAEDVRSIRPGLIVKALYGNVVHTPIAKELLQCDAIMLCTDEQWGRSVVNQISYQYLIPVINMGVRVDAPNGTISAAAGGVHTIGPDKPCLWCYEFLKADQIASESMYPEERRDRQQEGYVQGITVAPMVISLTSVVASLAVTELLHVLTGFRSERSIQCLTWDILSGRIATGVVQKKEKCICKEFLGKGDCAPIPTLDDNEFIERSRGKSARRD